MLRKDITLLNSLVSYVNDVKPYHTKFREFVSEVLLTDDFNVSVKEGHEVIGYLQNIWTRDSIGGHVLTKLSDGQEYDKIFQIPPAVYPRFTLNDRVGQTPVGDDPATLDFTDNNLDGIPDSEDPWTGPPTSSHFTTADSIPVFIKIVSRDPVIHNVTRTGSVLTVSYSLDLRVDLTELNNYGYDRTDVNVLVNNILTTNFTFINDKILISGFSKDITLSTEELSLINSQKLVTDDSFVNLHLRRSLERLDLIFINTGRYQVPFHQGSRVRVNSEEKFFGIDYVVDKSRSFIQFLPGSKPLAGSKIDVNLFRSDRIFISYNLPFDDGTLRLYDREQFDRLTYDYDYDYFLITVNKSLPLKCEIKTHFTEPDKSHLKAKLNVLNIKQAAVDGEVYKISAVGPWRFKVQKISPSVGEISYVIFKNTFEDTHLKFIIDRTWAPYHIESDSNSYISFDLLQFDTNIQESSDPSEFFSDLSIHREHGEVGSVLLHPVKYQPFGSVKKKKVQTLIGEKESYIFELDEIPPRWTYIELRVEQEGQYNPWVSTSIVEEIKFTDLIKFEDGICTNSVKYTGQFCTVNLNDMSLISIPLTVIPDRELEFYPEIKRVSWTRIGYDTAGTYDTVRYDHFIDLNWIKDLRLFSYSCSKLAYSYFYDEVLYDEGDLDKRSLYSTISDDMYFNVYLQDTGAVRIVHNVELHSDSNLYQEPQEVHELYIHRSGLAILNAIVIHEGIPFTPDELIIEPERVIVKMLSPRSIMVELL